MKTSLIAVSLLLAGPTLAQEIAQDSLETVLVRAAREPISISELGSAVTLLNSETLAQRQTAPLAEILRSVPGVAVSRAGVMGSQTQLRVRGGEANFAVVMIDGVQVNNPTNTRGGSFDFSTLDVSMIERIELIRGPQSAVYGADALSGALNIVTRRADPEGSAIVRAGEFARQ